VYRFEILSLIFQKLKKSRDSGHAPFRTVSSVGWNLHIKFEVCTLSRSRDVLGALKI